MNELISNNSLVKQLHLENNPNIKIISYKHNEYLTRESSEINALMIFVKGNAKVTKSTSDGKILLIDFYHEKGVIGDVEYFSFNKAACNVIAIAEVIVIKIPFSVLKRNLNQYPENLKIFTRGLAKKTRNNTDRAVFRSLYSITERVCTYIINVNINGVFKENLENTANLLATSYRHLLRVLQTLVKEGLLEKKSKGTYKILNKEALKNKANISLDIYF